MGFTSEEKSNILQTVLEKTNNLISIIDLEGKYLFKSHSLNKILANEENSSTGDIFNNIKTEDKEIFSNFLKQVINSGKGESPVYRIINSKNEIRFVKSTGERVCNQEGKPAKIVIISNDITKTKKLTEDVQKLLTIVEQSSEQVVITNKEGIIEYVNPAFEKITGYAKEEAIGKTIRKLISSKNDQKFYDDVWDKIAGGQSFHGEVINKTKDGEFFSVDKTVTPIKDKNGNVTHFVSTSKTLELHI